MQKENGDILIKFFVDSKKQVTISCPQCGLSKTVDTTKLDKNVKVVKVKCKCGRHFKGEIEFRKFYRKNVRLVGEYVQTKSNRKGEILIEDLSMGGLGFTCNASHAIKPGDHLEITFRLDDANRSEIKLKAVVKTIKNRFVGVERVDAGDYQQALGFYLM